MELIEEIKKNNQVLRIFRDENADNPREWENLGKFVLYHKQYLFSKELPINFDDFNGWEEVEKHLKDNFKAVLIKKVYLYDHSDLSISLKPFSCPFDSGVLGFICVLKEDILKEYGNLNKSSIKKAEKVLNSEFEIYKGYTDGGVYRFELYDIKSVKVTTTKEYDNEKTEKTEIIEEENLKDSCGGYYGEEGIKQIKEENKF